MRWLVLLAIVCVYAQEKVPKILVDQKDFHGFPESFNGLSVQTNRVKDATFHWLKDGKKITKESQPPFIEPFTTRLFLPNQRSKDYAGTYQFVMTAPAGTITGRKIKVAFSYVGTFDPNLPSNYSVNVTVGQANFIKCPKHTPGSNVAYKWGKSSRLSGIKFMTSKPNYIVLDDGTLFYSHLTQDDVKQFNKNEWSCGMEAKVKETSSFTWAELRTKLVEVDRNFTDFGPKIVTTIPQNKWFGEGETISIKCAAAGKPTPTYSWKRIDVDGKEFEVRDGEYGITFEDGDPRLLVMKKAARHHAGRYFCTATIGDKNDTVEGSLKFEAKPIWVGEMIKSVKPSIYSSHSWTCNATGVPMPTYKWYKNSNPLNSSERHTIDGGTLTFPSLEKSDTGMYECFADNRVDNIYQTAYLDVQAEKPVFDTNTGKTTLFLGAQGTMKCHAKAAPAAVNTWSKDGVAIDFTLSRYTLVNKEDLMIDSVSKQDIGNYTCIAKNQYGEDTKKISVQVVGEITFVEEPKDVVTTRGSTIKLKCRAEGDKESPIKATIKYKWKYNGHDIKLSDSILWSDSAHSLFLLKPQVSQSGEYECIAYIDQPSYAEKKRKAKVVIRGPPEAPNKVTIHGNCNSFSAKLMWHITNTNNDPIKYFIIQMATSFNTSWHNISEKVSATKDEKTIDNLSPWTKYRFRVLAINEIGASAPSEPTLFKDCETPQKAPTICPEMEVIPGKENELTVKWKKIELIDQNGPNFNYRLEYSSPQPKFSETKIFKPYELTFKVPNAGYHRPWTFKIQGFNNIGDGPFCKKDSYSGQNAPTKPPAGLTVKKFGEVYFVVQWNEITLTRGSVDGYKLTYSRSTSRRSISWENCDEKKPCELKIVGSGTTTARLVGLLPFTRYRIAVRGYNSGGLGPLSSISATTKQGRPGIPSDVNPIAFAKFIELQWGEPKVPNGIIIGYNVSIDKDAKPRHVVLEGTFRKYVFSGLVPNKEYIVYIQAKTKVGFGGKVVKVVTTTSLRIPAKPKAPVLTGIGENGVNVTFNEGKPRKGFPERFIVVYRVEGGKDVNWTKTGPVVLFGPDSKTYAEINDLDRTKEYEMATISVNEKGRSPMSDIVTVTPGNGEGITPPTTPPSEECSVTKLNLMFLVDGSGSVPVATFEEFKKFMTLLVEKFDVSPSTTRVCVLQYSSKPRTGLEFYFTEHETLAAVQTAISKVVYHYGAYTFGGYAMNLAQQIMNQYDRADAKNVWVLLMDDGLWDKTLARKISKSIRQSGTKIIVLDTRNVMQDIADHGFDFSSDNLQENVDAVAKEICN